MFLANLAEEKGIEIPGNPNSKDNPWVRAGKILKEAESNKILVDNLVFSRFETIDFDAAIRTVKGQRLCVLDRHPNGFTVRRAGVDQ